MRVLMIKLSSFGDIIHTLPALNALKKSYPEAEIDWITEEIGYSFLYGHPYLRKILLFPRHTLTKKLKKSQLLEVIKEIIILRKKLKNNYDLIIDFQGLLKSGFIAFLAEGKEKIGFANSREKGFFFFFTKKIKTNYQEHAILRYLKLLNCAGIPVSFKDISFPLPPVPNVSFDIKQPYIVINPVTRWESKMWFLEKWTALGKALLNLGYEVVFTGQKRDKEYIKFICQNIGSSINLAGKTDLKSLIPLYEKAHLVISLDTGTLHLAVATGTPTISLFGPTAPWRTGPFGKGHIVFFKKLSCQPCFKRKCKTRECMKKIEVEEIISAVKEMGG